MIYRVFIILVLNCFDLGMTTRLVNKFGIEVEGNPFGRWIFSSDMRLIIFKLLIPYSGAMLLYFTQDYTVSQVGSWVILVVYSLLAIYHIILSFVIKNINK